ncbi:MAG: HDOD domain-containing protein [Desulfobacterales bacterium]|nr:HDOD domain-containing protein [Desulfobacterales bacterium]
MENLFEKIKTSNHLPQLPQVMLQLVRACGDDKADIDELTRIISTDPALTSKLLQIIASPYVNLPRQVNTIKTAVVYLGLDSIRNIAISSSAMHFFKMSKGLPNFDINRFWYHSYKCGVLARRIAVEDNQINPDEFFLAGLLHDIGSLVLMRTFPKEYEAVLEDVAQGLPLAEAELARFKVDTPQVSAWLFNQWHLNPITSDSVLFLNEPLEKIQGELVHVKILYMANIMSGANPIAKMDEVLTLTTIPELRLEQIAAQADEEVTEMAKSLGVKLCKEEDDDCRVEETEDSQEVPSEIKDFTMFYGTLDNLLEARDLSSILDALQRGLEIVFHIPRVFFFLLDKDKNMLTGNCNNQDRHHNIVRSIALPLDSPASLVVKSVNTGDVLTSVGQEQMAVSDGQIIRFLETPGLYCIPIITRGQALGAMVLGVDEQAASILDQNRGLVGLFSRQAGICLENIDFHQAYARDLNEKKMEAYAALTDKVVHEINNPIAIIKNYLETLKLKLPDKHPAQEELSVVGEEMYRVSSLLEGLTSFSKPKIGGLEIIDLNQICSRVLEVLKKSILLPRQIAVQTDFDKGVPAVKMDGNGLKQVLINLVKNAAEAMENGGEIQFSTRLLPGSTKVLIDEKKKIPGFVEISIRDNGPGIPVRIRERLFEPYNSSKNNGSNSGLGLAIVHSIIKEMQGRITCDSRENQGTCFTIYLPLSPENQEQKQRETTHG